MASEWLDFAAIKRQVAIEDVLARLGYLEGLREPKSGKLVGPCPIHGGTGKQSFHVDTVKGIWNCFSVCKQGGNVLDLVMMAKQCSIREAGELLAEWFNLTFERRANDKKEAKVSGKQKAPTAAAAQSLPRAETINPPLERPLRNLNAEHPYIAERGITKETADEFGIGFCSVGLMRQRIAVPIHDANGMLLAYAGRAVDETLATEKGKWRLPDGFKKSYVLYNLDRAKAHDARELVVVEGFFDAMKVWQAGFKNVVALMGSTLSTQQEDLLVAHADCLALMFDGDEAGVTCLREFYRKLRQRMYLKEIHLDPGEQPDALSDDRIQELLGEAR